MDDLEQCVRLPLAPSFAVYDDYFVPDLSTRAVRAGGKKTQFGSRTKKRMKTMCEVRQDSRNSEQSNENLIRFI